MRGCDDAMTRGCDDTSADRLVEVADVKAVQTERSGNGRSAQSAMCVVRARDSYTVASTCGISGAATVIAVGPSRRIS